MLLKYLPFYLSCLVWSWNAQFLWPTGGLCAYKSFLTSYWSHKISCETWIVLQWASSIRWASSSFETGKAHAGFIRRIVRWSSVEVKRKISKAKRAVMETRRRGKSMRESILDTVYSTKEHTRLLKTRQWLDTGCCHSSWIKLKDLRCWKTVAMVAGLTLAGVIGLFHAWYVNSIHENLLWFSQLEVRRTTLKK